MNLLFEEREQLPKTILAEHLRKRETKNTGQYAEACGPRQTNLNLVSSPPKPTLSRQADTEERLDMSRKGYSTCFRNRVDILIN
jgi:hypothetical protein